MSAQFESAKTLLERQKRQRKAETKRIERELLESPRNNFESPQIFHRAEDLSAESLDTQPDIIERPITIEEEKHYQKYKEKEHTVKIGFKTSGLNFILIKDGIETVIGCTLDGYELEVEKEVTTDTYKIFDLADSKLPNINSSNPSKLLHNAVAIHLMDCFESSSSAYCRLAQKKYDLKFKIESSEYFIEVCEDHGKRKSLELKTIEFPEPKPFVIYVSKKEFAKVMEYPEFYTYASNLEQGKENFDLKLDRNIGQIGPASFLKDKDFLDGISKSSDKIMLRRLDQKIKNPVKFYKRNFLEKKNVYSKAWPTRVPWDYVKEKIRESEEKLNSAWDCFIRVSEKGFDNFIQERKDSYEVTFKDGGWDLHSDVTSNFIESQIMLNPEYCTLGIQSYEDFLDYAKKKDWDQKKISSKFLEGYGKVNILDDGTSNYVQIEEVINEITSDVTLPLDNDYFELLNKAAPGKSRIILNKVRDFLETSPVFHDASYYSRIARSISKNPSNTGRKRLVVRHRHSDVIAICSIHGNMSDKAPDSGFANIYFYFNSAEKLPKCYKHYRLPAGSGYMYRSQDFRMYKDQVEAYINMPSAMINDVYAFYEDLGNSKPVKRRKAKEEVKGSRVKILGEECVLKITEQKMNTFKVQMIPVIKKFDPKDFFEDSKLREMLNIRLSIINRCSWGMSLPLKIMNFYILNLYNRNPLYNKTQDKLKKEFDKRPYMLSSYPEIYYILKTLDQRELTRRSRTPIWNLPAKMLSWETGLMSLCPTILRSRKIHLTNCLSKISEESELYQLNSKAILSIQDDAEEIYKVYKKKNSISTKRLSDHYDLVDKISLETDGRFVYSPLVWASHLKSITDLKMSKISDSIKIKTFESLLTNKGSFDAIEMKNSKALISVLKECLILTGCQVPLTMTNLISLILYSFNNGSLDIKKLLLFGIVPKDQAGGDREISMLSGIFRVLQTYSEEISAHYEKQTGIGCLNNPKKIKEFLEDMSYNGETLAVQIDQTRWGPNFNTRVFGDMFVVLNTLGYPSCKITSIILYMMQHKIFVVPTELQRNPMNMHWTKGNSIGILSPAHMGEGIFHNASSLFHCFVLATKRRLTNLILRKYEKDCLIRYRVTSDDVSELYQNQNMDELTREILVRIFTNSQSLLTPNSILTSVYKNSYAIKEGIADFNSTRVEIKGNILVLESSKFMYNNSKPSLGHNMWMDFSSAESAFNTMVASGCSFCQAYILYISKYWEILSRWSLLGMAMKTGFLKLRTLNDMICKKTIFPSYYKLVAEPSLKFRIIKTIESFTPFKFKTKEIYAKFLDNSVSATSESLISRSLQGRSDKLRNSPESFALPISKYLCTSSYASKARVELSHCNLPEACLPRAVYDNDKASLRLFSYLATITDMSDQLPSIPIGVMGSAEYFIAKGSAKHTWLFRDNTPMNDKPEYSQMSLSSAANIQLSTEEVFMSNYGSSFKGRIGKLHERLFSERTKNLTILPSLSKGISEYFNDDKDAIYSYIDSLCENINKLNKSSSFFILGEFNKGNGLRKNVFRGYDCKLGYSSIESGFPMSKVFIAPALPFIIDDRLRDDQKTLCRDSGKNTLLFSSQNEITEINLKGKKVISLGAKRRYGGGSQSKMEWSVPMPGNFYSLKRLVEYIDLSVGDMEKCPNRVKFIVDSAIPDFVKEVISPSERAKKFFTSLVTYPELENDEISEDDELGEAEDYEADLSESEEEDEEGDPQEEEDEDEELDILDEARKGESVYDEISPSKWGFLVLPDLEALDAAVRDMEINRDLVTASLDESIVEFKPEIMEKLLSGKASKTLMTMVYRHAEISDEKIRSLLYKASGSRSLKEALREFIQSKRGELWKWAKVEGKTVMTSHSSNILKILKDRSSQKYLPFLYSHFDGFPAVTGTFKTMYSGRYKISPFVLGLCRRIITYNMGTHDDILESKRLFLFLCLSYTSS